jgi:hypothetical protein
MVFNRLFCFIVFFSLARLCPAEDFRPFDGPQPLLVAIETDPWAMVLGSDSPRVAIYENGDAVFVRGSGASQGYYFTRLAPSELNGLLQQARAAFGSQGLKHRYDMGSATDQPMAKFYFYEAGSSMATEVYGLDCSPSSRFQRKSDSGQPPQALLDLNKSLCGLDVADSKKWVPRYVEVMMWDYGYAPGRSAFWPKDWPGLNSPRTIKRGDAYSIFLDGTMLPKLQSFLRGIGQKSATVIDGKKMAVSYRYPFPSEPIWSKAFRSIE